MAEASETPPTAGEGDVALLEIAIEAARAGGETLERYFRSADLRIESKGGQDFVTEADHASEARILEIIRQRFPDHQVLAEESGWQGDAGRFGWLVDPLDGTSNFLQGLPVFCVSIACLEGDTLAAAAILDPIGGNLFTARRGAGAFWNGAPMRVSQRSQRRPISKHWKRLISQTIPSLWMASTSSPTRRICPRR